jgi:hypothetical protein
MEDYGHLVGDVLNVLAKDWWTKRLLIESLFLLKNYLHSCNSVL